MIEHRGPEHTVVRDEGSACGTFVNGARVREVGLRPGALLRMGAIELVALGERRYGPGSAFSRLIGRDPAFRRGRYWDPIPAGTISWNGEAEINSSPDS